MAIKIKLHNQKMSESSLTGILQAFSIHLRRSIKTGEAIFENFHLMPVVRLAQDPTENCLLCSWVLVCAARFFKTIFVTNHSRAA